MKSIFKKATAYFVAFAMLIALFPLSALPASASAALSGTGTQDDPFLIKTHEDLTAFRDSVNSGNDYAGRYVKLTADYVSVFEYSNEKFIAWEPIGSFKYDDSGTGVKNAMPFNGTFDGGGNTISVYDAINGGSDCSDYRGLFGLIGESGTIKNLTVSTGHDFYSNKYAGTVAILNKGTIENVRATGTELQGLENVGGIAAENRGIITDCVSEIAEIASGNSDNFGGIAGTNFGGQIIRCKSTLNYVCRNNTTSTNVGGICGYSTNDGDKIAVIKESYNSADVFGESNVGGIVGNATGTEISDCYNVGSVTAKTANAGGICGAMTASTSVSNVYSYGNITVTDTAAASFGGICGAKEDTCTVENAYFLDSGVSGENHTVAGTALTITQFWAQENFSGFNFTDTWVTNVLLGRPMLRAVPELNAGTEAGTAEEPYKISSADELNSLRDAVNSGNSFADKYVKLTEDIIIGEFKAPIGEYDYDNSIDNPFSGTFDGDNHTIFDLYFRDDIEFKSQGLFGYLGKDGTVKNLTVWGNGSNTEKNNVGIVVGYNKGTIENVTARGMVSGDEYVGGIAGNSVYGTIRNCRNFATVSGSQNVGGIAGCIISSTNNQSVISDCYNMGNVTGVSKTDTLPEPDPDGNTTEERLSSSVGGIVGACNGTVSKCYNAGDISGGDSVGGIAGSGFGAVGAISDCYNIGNVNAEGSSVGGISGALTNGTNISNVYNYGTVSVKSGAKNYGTICGRVYNSEVTGAYYLDESAPSGADSTYGASLSNSDFGNRENFNEFDFTDTWEINQKSQRPELKSNREKSGAKSNPILIGTLAELEAFRDSVNNGDNHENMFVQLTADIDMSQKYGANGEKWTPIGRHINDYRNDTWFKGTFDGNGHKITGLYIDNSDKDYQGLFGLVNYYGTVRNLTVSGDVTGSIMTGMVVGLNIGTIENVTAYGTVNGTNYVGGIVGYNEIAYVYGTRIPGVIRQCANFAVVNGNMYIGGICGTNKGTIQNCYNTAQVTANQNGAGGIFGYNVSGTIQNCYNTAQVTAEADAGGIYGYGSGGTIQNCFYNSETFSGECAGTPLSAAEFGNSAKFTDWDFTDVWDMDIFLERPVLRACSESAAGTESDPYKIGSIASFEKFRDSVNSGNTYEGKHIKLAVDIDMSETYGKDKQSWTPIGDKATSKSFNGVFDGDNHKISGLYINGNGDDKGLFGLIDQNAVVKNLSVSGEVSGNETLGILACQNSGKIENISVSGSVAGSTHVGGICGTNDGTAENCYNAATVTATKDYVGGICGTNYSSINNCYNVGNITATDGYAGGICGTDYGSINNCYNYASVSSNGSKAAICGDAVNFPVNCYYNGDAFDGDAYIISGMTYQDGKLSEAEFADKSKFTGFDFDNTWVMDKNAARPLLINALEPSGTAHNPVKIRTLADLKEFRDSVNNGDNYSGKKVVLMADIAMSADNWTPIGNATQNEFSGTFDGGGHTISGLFINVDYGGNKGLFGVNSGTVKNLTVTGNVTATVQSVALAVGLNLGTVENVHADGYVEASSQFGMVVGQNSGNVIRCTSAGKFSGNNTAPNAGGVCGSNNQTGKIEYCRNAALYVTNDENGDTATAAGICGRNSGTISYCYNTAELSGRNAAGICNYNFETGTISNCYNIAALSAENTASGICRSNSGTITNCYHYGTLKGTTVSPISSVNYDGSAVNNSFYNGEAFSGDYAGTPLSAAEFGNSAKFTDWDFANTWEINPLLARPVLRSNAEGESGAKSDPYVIDNLETFEKFRDSVNNGINLDGKFVKLTSDIDLSEKYNANNQWTPVGTQGNPFSGTFDGNGHKISGLYINDTSKEYQGLFGTVSGGTIKKLGVTDALVAAKHFGGIAAKVTDGKIENCYYNGNLASEDVVYCYYGAIAGDIEKSSITNCYANAKVYDYAEKGAFGVIVGYAGESQITSCYFIDYGTKGAVGVQKQSTIDSYTGGKTAAELADQSTYVGWDFENVWTMHPILKLPTFAGGFSGEGTENDPYIMTTLEDLEILSSAVNSGNTFEGVYFALGADIDMSQKYNAQTGKSWTPIGNYSNGFAGVFDGGNHNITGLYIEGITDYNCNVGLFGNLKYNAMVKNLFVSGKIENCGGNDGLASTVGGLVGLVNYGATVENCGAKVDITSASSSYRVGGLAGYNYGTIKNSFASGNVSAEGTVGGLVGCNDGDGTLQNCYTTGTVSGESSVGGLVGHHVGKAVNCYSSAAVTGGYPLFGSGWGPVENCYYTGETADLMENSIKKTKAQFASGEVAYLLSMGCTVDDTTYDGNVWKQTIGTDAYPNFTGGTVSCTAGCPSYNNDGNTAEKAHIPNDDGICTICGAYEGAKLVDGAYQINNKLDLIWFAQHVNSGATTANANVTANINLNESVFDSDGNLLTDLESFTPIGTADNPYSGTFSGNGHTVGGIYIKNDALEYAGLFGVTAQSAVIKDVCIQESYIGANKYVGALVGQNNGTVELCTVGKKTTVEKLGSSEIGGDFIGGVCGDNNGKIIGDEDMPLFSGNLIGSGRYMGGVCGRNAGTVTNAVNNGTIDTNGSQVGGIVGVNDSDGITANSVNHGAVYGYSEVGGICGENKGTIKNCTNSEADYNTYVSAKTYYAGGIVGSNYGNVTLCVNNEKTQISASTSSNGYAGGIAGSNGESNVNGTIADCINLSTNISGYKIGGIVGYSNFYYGNVQNCADTAAGSIAGMASANLVTNCYYNDLGKETTCGTALTANSVTSGEMAYKLQNGRQEQVWGQRIGTDTAPVLASDQDRRVVRARFTKTDGTVTEQYCNADTSFSLPETTGVWMQNGKNVSDIISDDIDAKEVLYYVVTSGSNIAVFAQKGDCVAVVAAYDANGNLVQAEKFDLHFDQFEEKYIYAEIYSYASAKVFLWDNLDDMNPLCEPVEITD